jgi:broad specificity phosphatase PhoE
MPRSELNLSIDLIRHSTTRRNQNSQIIGQDAEEPLAPEGVIEANKLAARFQQAGITHDCLFVSPYTRAQETCKIVCAHYPKGTPIITVPEIREINQGEAKGKDRRELYTPEKQDYYEHMGMAHHHPKGESLFELEHRVFGWFQKEVLNNPQTRTDKELKLAIFSHGLSIKVFLHSVLQFDHRMCWRLQISNASISSLRLKDGLWYVDTINDTAHLL